MTAVIGELEDTRVEARLAEPGDHDTFSHYVYGPDLTRAMLDGVACKALCGKLWLPTKDHTKYPVCPDCKAKHEALE